MKKKPKRWEAFNTSSDEGLRVFKTEAEYREWAKGNEEMKQAEARRRLAEPPANSEGE